MFNYDISHRSGQAEVISPIGKPEYKSRDGHASRIADNRGKGRGEDHCPKDQPSTSQISPFLSQGFQPCEDLLVEDKEQDPQYSQTRKSYKSQNPLRKGKLFDRLEELSLKSFSIVDYFVSKTRFRAAMR